MGVSSKSEIMFGPKTRVYAYGLFQTPDVGERPIYVHSKLVIIDDRYVAIGSANVDARSMHIETELTLGIVDAKTEKSQLDGQDADICVFARNLREKLWKEHLGVKDLPPDPIKALGNLPQGFTFDWSKQQNPVYTWPVNENEANIWTTHHIRCYVNQPGSAHTLTAAGKRMLDRNQRQWRHQIPGT